MADHEPKRERTNLITSAGKLITATIKGLSRPDSVKAIGAGGGRSSGGLGALWNDTFSTLAAASAYRQEETMDVEATLRLAVTTSWVYSDIKLISDRLAGGDALPVVKRRKQGGDAEELKHHDFTMLLQQPNALSTGSFLTRQMIQWYLLTGNAYVFIATDNVGVGKPKELWLLNAPLVMPIPKSIRDGKGVFRGKQVIDYAYNVNGKVRILPGENVAHFRFPNTFDDWRGMSPLSSILTGIQLDQAQQKWLRDFYGKDNAVPTAIISVPKETDDDELAVIARDLKEQFGENRKSAITRAGDLSVEVLTQTIESMGITNSRQFTQQEIDRVYGVPQGLQSGALSGDSRLAAEISFARNTTQPLLDYLCAEWTANVGLYYGADIVIDAPDIIPQERALKVQEYTTYSQDRTVNENRDVLGLKPLEGDAWEKLPVRVLDMAMKTGEFGFTPEHQKQIDQQKQQQAQQDQVNQQMQQERHGAQMQILQAQAGQPPQQPGAGNAAGGKKVGNLPGAPAPKALVQTMAGKSLALPASTSTDDAGDEDSPNSENENYTKDMPALADGDDAERSNDASPLSVMPDPAVLAAGRAELAQWRKVAHKALKAGQQPRPFKCYVLPEEIQEYVNVALPALGIAAFTGASELLDEYTHAKGGGNPFLEPHTARGNGRAAEVETGSLKFNANHDRLGRFASGGAHGAGGAGTEEGFGALHADPATHQKETDAAMHFIDRHAGQTGKARDEAVTAIAGKLTQNPAFIDYMNKQYADSPRKLKPENDTPENRAAMLIHSTIATWAGTSGDHNAKALALQQAAQEEFGLHAKALTFANINDRTRQSTQEVYDQHGAAYRAILREMYNHTQAEFAKAGITHVPLYRGMQVSREAMPEWIPQSLSRTRQHATPELQPISSFTSDRSVAHNFARGSTPNHRGVLLSARVPVHRILSAFGTGFGTDWEHEYVVMHSGGQAEVEVP